MKTVGTRRELRLRLPAFAFAVSVATLGCQAQPSGTAALDASFRFGAQPSDAGLVGVAASGPSNGDAANDAGARVQDGGTPVGQNLKSLPVEVLAETADGTKRQLAVGQPNSDVPPDSRFTLTMPPMADVRVRLFDDADRIIASNDKLELGLKTTRYLLTPAQPLVAGTDYTLVIDGLKGELAIGVSGSVYGATRIALSTSGEKPPPAASPKDSRGNKKRR